MFNINNQGSCTNIYYIMLYNCRKHTRNGQGQWRRKIERCFKKEQKGKKRGNTGKEKSNRVVGEGDRRKESKNKIMFKIAKKDNREKRDVAGPKFANAERGKIMVEELKILKRCSEYFSEQLNEENYVINETKIRLSTKLI